MQAVRFKTLENFISGLHIHELHTAFWQMIHFQERIVGENRKNICQGIAYAQNGFHTRICFEIIPLIAKIALFLVFV